MLSSVDFDIDGSEIRAPRATVIVGVQSVASLVIMADDSPLPLCRVLIHSNPIVQPSSIQAEQLIAADGADLTLTTKELVHPELECFNTTDADPDILIDFGTEVDLSTLTIMSSESKQQSASSYHS